MSDDPAAFRRTAERHRREAAETLLENVRQRCLRSAELWEEMADRAERSGRERLVREAATRTRSALTGAD